MMHRKRIKKSAEVVVKSHVVRAPCASGTISLKLTARLVDTANYRFVLPFFMHNP